MSYLHFTGKNSTTLLVFLILSLIINFALAAGILYLLRVYKQSKESSVAVELDNVKNGSLNGEQFGRQNNNAKYIEIFILYICNESMKDKATSTCTMLKIFNQTFRPSSVVYNVRNA